MAGNLFYKEVQGDYLLLVLDPAKLTAKVVFEPAAPVGSKSSDGLTAAEEEPVLFPHLVRATRPPPLQRVRDHSMEESEHVMSGL